MADFEEEVGAIKTLQKDLEKLDFEKITKLANIEQFKIDIAQMSDRRDYLENTINNASAMILSGTLTGEDYINSKKELAGVYKNLDDKDCLLAIFEKSIDMDYRLPT